MIFILLLVAFFAFLLGTWFGTSIKEKTILKYVQKKIRLAKFQKDAWLARENKAMASTWASRVNELQLLAYTLDPTED